jgi:hypothetical protein
VPHYIFVVHSVWVRKEGRKDIASLFANSSFRAQEGAKGMLRHFDFFSAPLIPSCPSGSFRLFCLRFADVHPPVGKGCTRDQQTTPNKVASYFAGLQMSLFCFVLSWRVATAFCSPSKRARGQWLLNHSSILSAKVRREHCYCMLY